MLCRAVHITTVCSITEALTHTQHVNITAGGATWTTLCVCVCHVRRCWRCKRRSCRADVSCRKSATEWTLWRAQVNQISWSQSKAGINRRNNKKIQNKRNKLQSEFIMFIVSFSHILHVKLTFLLSSYFKNQFELFLIGWFGGDAAHGQEVIIKQEAADRWWRWLSKVVQLLKFVYTRLKSAAVCSPEWRQLISQVSSAWTEWTESC